MYHVIFRVRCQFLEVCIYLNFQISIKMTTPTPTPTGIVIGFMQNLQTIWRKTCIPMYTYILSNTEIWISQYVLRHNIFPTYLNPLSYSLWLFLLIFFIVASTLSSILGSHIYNRHLCFVFYFKNFQL